MNSWNDYALRWQADKSWVVVEDRRILAASKLGYLERLGDEWGTEESVDQIVSEFILPYTGMKKVIVEIGSGGGRIAHRVAPHVSHLICIDVERDMLRLCSAALSNAANVTCLLISKSSCIPLISDSVDSRLQLRHHGTPRRTHHFPVYAGDAPSGPQRWHTHVACGDA